MFPSNKKVETKKAKKPKSEKEEPSQKRRLTYGCFRWLKKFIIGNMQHSSRFTWDDMSVANIF